MDFSISVGHETAGENIRGYELLISPKRRGITIVQVIEMWPYNQMLYIQTGISTREWHA